jgi:hypothetical protein
MGIGIWSMHYLWMLGVSLADPGLVRSADGGSVGGRGDSGFGRRLIRGQ